ncbi:beta-galactosidase [Galbitalea sp. SE-J8]|uniref:glycoside hydrolase family 35 protein n=1 Tax=Galbitalea sp. SE-J8 TaxID=3054952 RepID=UPI00259C6A1A|nr:beta-galactosidase [Galbitalea sp. SE-J8]MDM4764245.1 beta-galactosidase [Galbitalea sp. SE-J8]
MRSEAQTTLAATHSFAIGDEDFLLDGSPFRIISGAIHYFRVHPDQWADRIHKARLMGLNTVETYVAWNFHSSRPGEFRTDGARDLGRFLDLVAAEGLHAIVRPGPYICAEWTNGGLPTWLTADRDVRLRSSDARFVSAVGDYLDELAPILAPRQIDAGGPIILMQIENEYGAYGDDKAYLARLVELYRAAGLTVPLTTVDQPFERMLQNGRLEGVHATASFGSRSRERLATLRGFQPAGPLMCSEFWDGWFDSWGTAHHVTSAAAAARELDELLAAGASVNIYMFVGGTNFGLSNGANHKGLYQPIVTSYDYDAALAEDGSPAEKFWAFREVIARYAPVPDEVPAARAPAPAFSGVLDRRADWRAATLDSAEPRERGTAPTFDDLLHDGFLLYRHAVSTADRAVLLAPEVRDRGQVFLDGDPVGVIQRDQRDAVLALPAVADGALEILVEEMGRVNYADRIGEWKGLGPVSLDGRALDDWSVHRVDLDPDRIERALSDGGGVRAAHAVAGPVVLGGGFVLDEPADLFLATDGWGKGIAWVNGFALGRYWSRGPQATLYVPAGALRAGENRLALFELTGVAAATFRFVAQPALGPTEL